ncbi:MAG: hypothetical protein A2V70_05770 [Planctomycetes bacterium RBG_13_63_9]|nr:MAG: hypothetical protein A2V70_05770 [Planctomycetes bacterium RBG_13_63_9]
MNGWLRHAVGPSVRCTLGGDQVQDGGAVLGFSYYDLMARLKVLGPDNAWQRLTGILDGFEDVQSEDGYRAYYARPGRGTLQGGGTPGGLGIDHEFLESVLVPQRRDSNTRTVVPDVVQALDLFNRPDRILGHGPCLRDCPCWWFQMPEFGSFFPGRIGDNPAH